MKRENYNQALDQVNIPIFIFSLIEGSLSYQNPYCKNFQWDVCSINDLFKKWEDLKKTFNEHNETSTEVRVKNQNKKNFIYNFTIKKSDEFLFCFGENKTEINEHKLMIKSFTTMVEQTNKKLKQKSNELENILNTMHQATFMVAKDFIIESPVSAFAKNIFEQDILDKDIFEILYNHLQLNKEQIADIKSCYATIFGEDETQWELMSDIFPKESILQLANKQKFVSIDTYPIWNDNKVLDKIMIVIQDLTEVNELKDANREKDKKVQIIQELAEQEPKDLGQYFRSSLKLLTQSKGLIEILESSPQLIDDLFRNMHTLKGNSRLFNLSIMSKSAHAVEDTIKEMREKGLINGELYKRLESEHQVVNEELSRYSKIAKDILKISDEDITEHVVNLINMLLEIECHLQANSEKSLGHIDTALAACSSWALALDDDLVSSYIFEINRLILNEEFLYRDHEDVFTQKITETISFLCDRFNFNFSPEMDFFSNAVSFILELAQICQNDSKRIRTPHLQALYRNSSSIALRKIYELKVLNISFDNNFILRSLGYEAQLISDIDKTFLEKLKAKAQALEVNLDFLNYDLPSGLIPCSFMMEKKMLLAKPSNKIQKRKTIEIYSNEIQEILFSLEHSPDFNRNELLEKIQYLTYDSLKERIEKFKNLVEGIAFNSKKQCHFTVEGSDFRISPDKSGLLLDSLLHLITNAIDHGIETNKERLEKNKNEIGKIQVFLSNQDHFYQIKVCDDGRGLYPDQILERALDLEIIKESDKLSKDQILDLIFHPGLSTKEVVNETSGRGIGMNVVKTNIDEINGTIVIESEPDQGSYFTIQIPK